MCVYFWHFEMCILASYCCMWIISRMQWNKIPLTNVQPSMTCHPYCTQIQFYLWVPDFNNDSTDCFTTMSRILTSSKRWNISPKATLQNQTLTYHLRKIESSRKQSMYPFFCLNALSVGPKEDTRGKLLRYRTAATIYISTADACTFWAWRL